jgi:lipopolysaccharide export system protein LptC
LPARRSGITAMQADRYSRLVGWLKVLLPLTALGLLSTLFLISKAIDTETAIPFADKEIQDRLRSQQVTGPIYYSVTADGDQIAFAAETLTTPEGKTGANEALDVEIAMDLSSGSKVIVTSQRGFLDIEKDFADLFGVVTIDTSTGYHIKSDRLTALMSTLDIVSPGPVQADGPFGTLDAGTMSLKNVNAGSGAQLLFTNGVKLVYLPKQHNE